MLNNLIKIENLSKEEILMISDLALEFKNGKNEILNQLHIWYNAGIAMSIAEIV